jgi:hypothetical protein
VPATFTHEDGGCEYHVSVPARHLVLFSGNQICSDGWRQQVDEPGRKPSFVYLRIESAVGAVEWRGWEVSEALKSDRGTFRIGTCRIDFR